jgi:predicted ATPase/DNA-binding SARP family transcriptional activator
MRYGVLGPLQVRAESGDEIPVGGPKPRALLVMLLLNADRLVSVEQLIDGQYGDDPPSGAANAVQAQVSRLRRSLSGDLIEFHGTGYRLAVDPQQVDVHVFDDLARAGRRQLTSGNPAQAAETLRAALALWRGPALADLPYARAQAARLDELWIAATEDLVDAELALPAGTSVAELRTLVAAHPLRERLRGQLMRALRAAGRQAEALAEFEQVRKLLSVELGADPSAELAAIHLGILREEQPARPGLPGQLTSFVGRGSDLARLAELRTARLVTILGPGGIGKTRLAIQAAGRDGREVCFADLSPISDPDQLPLAVLNALGKRESGFQPAGPADPVHLLTAALSEQNLLLVLDNCEQLIDAVATLARTLLAQSPLLAILATSREPLGLTGEMLLPLETFDQDPAVRLFADRAAAVRPDFAVRPENVDTVTRICAALDGLPLAIELAAARLRQFGIDEIDSRLAEHGRFRLLSRGDRTAAARHRTLRGVVEWSWDLLDSEEKLLARRFSVFTGGAPLAAVEPICGVLDDVLASLVDKSLIETDGERYRMLETIRLFCAERLAEAGEEDTLRQQHARYFLEMAQNADPHLRRAEQLEWLAILATDHANLMAALQWSAHHEPGTGCQLVAALAAYWWLSGRRSQAGDAASVLLAADIPDEEYVSCVVHAVPTAPADHWARAAEIVRTRDKPPRYPFGAALWGMAAGPPEGPPEEAGRMLGTDPWNVALGQLSIALLSILGGQPASGEREMLAALETFRGLGERWGTAQALDWLAVVSSWRGEWSRATEYWAQSYALQEQFEALEECADVLGHRAECLVRQGDLDAAEVDLRQAGELLKKAARQSKNIQLGFAELARLRGDLTKNATFDTADASVLTSLGRLAEANGDLPEAVRLHGEALAIARTSPVLNDLAHAVEGAAGVEVLAGDAERAALLLGVAVAMRGMAVAGDPDVAKTAENATARIGSEAFAGAYARGAAMSREEALSVTVSGLSTDCQRARPSS